MKVSPIYTINAAVNVELKQEEQYEVIDTSEYYYLIKVGQNKAWVSKDEVTVIYGTCTKLLSVYKQN